MSSLFPPPSLTNTAAYKALRVGLLGGSFNPAHAAHLQLAKRALETLNLDVIWWLVSPQNPLKSTQDMAPLATRVESVQPFLKSPRMVVTDIENQLGTQFTADTLRLLKLHFPQTEFVWMMGADSFRNFHRWDHWRDIVRMVPMAIFARPPQQLRALSGFAAQTLRKYRRKHLTGRAPEWTYVTMPLNSLSATEIRAHHGNSKKNKNGQ